jgi:tRNA uridine 5-carboxymethylaminomethyl modification enzyme
MVSKKDYERYIEREKTYNEFVKKVLEKTKLKEFTDKENKTVKLDEKRSISQLLTRPDIDETKIIKLKPEQKELFKRASTEIKYKGYIEKQLREVNKNRKQNNKKIPEDLEYNKISGLSNEVVEKLSKTRPETIGSASRIEGITPAAINLILVSIKKSELIKADA